MNQMTNAIAKFKFLLLPLQTNTFPSLVNSLFYEVQNGGRAEVRDDSAIYSGGLKFYSNNCLKSSKILL
jgi:hypothetical protein